MPTAHRSQPSFIAIDLNHSGEEAVTLRFHCSRAGVKAGSSALRRGFLGLQGFGFGFGFRLTSSFLLLTFRTGASAWHSIV
jgi:hypothetical protein